MNHTMAHQRIQNPTHTLSSALSSDRPAISVAMLAASTTAVISSILAISSMHQGLRKSAMATSTTVPRFCRLIWLMPAVFAPHIIEEYGTGFPDWVTHTLGSSMTDGVFLLNNAVFMAILLSLTAWAAFRPSPLSAFVLLSWASGNLFWNFVFHLVTTFLYDRLSPGLITAVVLYFPISVAVGWLALDERVVSRMAFAGAVSIGAALMLFVIWAGLFQPAS